MPGGYRMIRYPPVVLNQQEVDSVTAVNRKKVRPKSFERKLERTAYLFIMPAAILLIIFCIVPMLGSFFVSTQKMGVDLSKAEFSDWTIIPRHFPTADFCRALGSL